MPDTPPPDLATLNALAAEAALTKPLMARGSVVGDATLASNEKAISAARSDVYFDVGESREALAGLIVALVNAYPSLRARLAAQERLEAENARLREVCDRAAEALGEKPPDDTWFRDYFELTGDHMVLTDEGWIPAEMNTPEAIGGDPCEVLDEVNAPAPAPAAESEAKP